MLQRAIPPVLACAVLACVAIGVPAAAAPTTQAAKVQATVVKPLTLTRVQDLDLGAVVLAPGAWAGATVAISRGGLFSCASANVTCTGATQTARYSVTGTNNQVVRITAPNVTMVNQSDATKTLVLTVDSPATVTIVNAGKKGVEFAIGGSIALNSDTAGGVYAGTFNVTVDY